MMFTADWLMLAAHAAYALGLSRVYSADRAVEEMGTTKDLVVHSDPEIMSGIPVFVGTRVPCQTLLDYVNAGQPLSEFLQDFPSVSRKHALAALELLRHSE